MNLPRPAARLVLVLAVAGLLASSACQGVREIPGRTQQRLSGAPVRSADVPGQPRDVYQRAKDALPALGFRFERGGAAQGYLEALSVVGGDNALRGATQRRLVAAFGFGDLPDTTRVDVTVTEIIEENSRDRAGFGTEMPLRDAPLYGVFLRALGAEEPMPLPTVAPAATGTTTGR